MEIRCGSFGEGVWLLGFYIGIFLLFHHPANAQEKMSDPRSNVNLSPVWQWRSAYECMQNISGCRDEYTITEEGWINVTVGEAGEYCKEGGCAEQTMAVLSCIGDVKRDYWFANKATVRDLNHTITRGCAVPSGFTGQTQFLPNGVNALASKPLPFVSALSALVFIALFHM